MKDFDHLFLQTRRECPVCGRAFIVPPENVYKLYIGGKWVDFCRYNCFRSEQLKQKPKQNRGAGRRWKKRIEAEDTI